MSAKAHDGRTVGLGNLLMNTPGEPAALADGEQQERQVLRPVSIGFDHESKILAKVASQLRPGLLIRRGYSHGGGGKNLREIFGGDGPVAQGCLAPVDRDLYRNQRSSHEAYLTLGSRTPRLDH